MPKFILMNFMPLKLSKERIERIGTIRQFPHPPQKKFPAFFPLRDTGRDRHAFQFKKVKGIIIGTDQSRPNHHLLTSANPPFGNPTKKGGKQFSDLRSSLLSLVTAALALLALALALAGLLRSPAEADALGAPLSPKIK